MLQKLSDNNSILLRLYTSQHNIKCGSINNNKKHIHTADTRTTQNIEFFSHLFLLTVVNEKNHFFFQKITAVQNLLLVANMFLFT